MRHDVFLNHIFDETDAIFTYDEMDKLANYTISGKLALEISDPTQIVILKKLITSMLIDKNSSTLREQITAHVCGYIWIPEKLGYDAYDIDENGNRLHKEIKPKYHYYKDSSYNGSGNFSDYTFERLNKDLNDTNLTVITSMFSNGRLVYILEFPFGVLYDTIYRQLTESITNNGNRYCRSCSFTYKDFIYSLNMKIHYLDVPSMEGRVTKIFKRLLMSRYTCYDTQLLKQTV